MNLDELMEVWKLQDAAPLHDVNKTLLHLALRRDEEKLRKEQRRDRWTAYVFGAAIVAGLAFFLVLMIHAPQRYVTTGWDYVMGIGGAAAALFTIGAMYMGRRAQARREQRFGESLRDQINRRIAQIDDAATGGRRRDWLVFVMMGTICPLAILYFTARINDQSIRDVLYLITAVIIWGLWSGTRELRRFPRKNLLVIILMGAICAIAVTYLKGPPPYFVIVPMIWFLWAVGNGVRRSLQRDLSRKHRLETLLKELDGQ